MEEKKSSKKIIILVAILLIIFTIIAVVIYLKMKEQYENDTTQPVIYYSFDEVSKLPLLEDNTFSQNTSITWTKDCKGEIKKDQKIIAKELGTIISEEGKYEITITSPSGKNKTTKMITIDKTPPEVKITKSSSGTYTIQFADITDVGTAKLTKFDKETNELIEEKDLTKGGLQPVIEIKEKGYYMLEIKDKLGNTVKENTNFKIK